MQQGVKEKARALLENGTVSRVLGWKKGEFCYDLTPAVFASPEEVDRNFVYSDFSGANLSKYLIAESKKEGKIAAFLKPCDSYSFVQLLKEHRICRENVYVVGVACDGMCDARMLEEKGGVLSVEARGIPSGWKVFTARKTLPERICSWSAAGFARAKKSFFLTKCWANREKKSPPGTGLRR